MNSIEVSAMDHTIALIAADKPAHSVEDIMRLLEAHILRLLNDDFNGLLNMLYRIDISEARARDCFGKPNPDIAACLAKLVWQRQLAKAETRERYRNQ